MPFTFKKTLMGRLLRSFVGIAVVPILTVGFLAFMGALDALREAEFAALNSVLELKKDEV